MNNPDGTYQRSARPFPTISRYLVSAFGLRFLGHLNHPVLSDEYEGWKGDTEREVDWQSGCCVMLRGDLLGKLGGFDERFFYQFEEVDLCRRVWAAGYRIRFTPEVIHHSLGRSIGRTLPGALRDRDVPQRISLFLQALRRKRRAIQCRAMLLMHMRQ